MLSAGTLPEKPSMFGPFAKKNCIDSEGDLPPFTHVVPLGISCRVTYQVRVCFRSWKVYPFDWWITPLAGLTRYLAEPDISKLYASDSLQEIFTDGEVSAIRSTVYGFRLFHEFPRQPGANVLAAVAPGWRTHIGAAAERHEKRLGRLLRLNRRGNRILFVRHQFCSEPGVKSEEDPGPAVAAIWEVLRSNWREADISLLLVNFAPVCSLPEGVLLLDFEELPGPPQQLWRGDDEQWKRNFTSRGLVVRPRPHIHLRRSPGPPN
jgi:hypothetical protein